MALSNIGTGLDNEKIETGEIRTTGKAVVGGTLSVTGATSLGAVSGTTGSFSGAVSGTTGTFSSHVSGVNGTFSGAVAGTTGTFSDHVSTSVAGKGFKIKEGANAMMGTATLNGTTEVVVATTAVTANSRIFVFHQAVTGTPGVLYVSSRSAATNFGLKSTAATDTSIVAWVIIEPSA